MPDEGWSTKVPLERIEDPFRRTRSPGLIEIVIR
jgi:hypothetical protein